MREPSLPNFPIVAPIRLRNLLWVPVIGSAFGLAAMFGTPHLRVHYTYHGSHEKPYYLDCSYWGLGSFRVRPLNGRCPLIVLKRDGSDGAR